MEQDVVVLRFSRNHFDDVSRVPRNDRRRRCVYDDFDDRLDCFIGDWRRVGAGLHEEAQNGRRRWRHFGGKIRIWICATKVDTDSKVL